MHVYGYVWMSEFSVYTSYFAHFICTCYKIKLFKYTWLMKLNYFYFALYLWVLEKKHMLLYGLTSSINLSNKVMLVCFVI